MHLVSMFFMSTTCVVFLSFTCLSLGPKMFAILVLSQKSMTIIIVNITLWYKMISYKILVCFSFSKLQNRMFLFVAFAPRKKKSICRWRTSWYRGGGTRESRCNKGKRLVRRHFRKVCRLARALNSSLILTVWTSRFTLNFKQCLAVEREVKKNHVSLSCIG